VETLSRFKPRQSKILAVSKSNHNRGSQSPPCVFLVLSRMRDWGSSDGQPLPQAPAPSSRRLIHFTLLTEEGRHLIVDGTMPTGAARGSRRISYTVHNPVLAKPRMVVAEGPWHSGYHKTDRRPYDGRPGASQDAWRIARSELTPEREGPLEPWSSVQPLWVHQARWEIGRGEDLI
jgi:hypothetical protein